MVRINRVFSFLLFFFLLFPPFSVVSRAASAEEITNGAVFLGDSTTAHMKSRAAVRADQVWATRQRYLNLDPRVTSAKIEVNGAEMTIAEAAAHVRPRYLVITLGIDYGVYYYRDQPEKFRACYEKLLDVIGVASPETVLILQSVFPVGRTCRVVDNRMVDRANEVIRAIAVARGLYYLDSNAALKDDEGYLAPAYIADEAGIHLSAAGYKVVLENLRAHAGEIGGAA